MKKSTQKNKTKFRSSKAWISFRKELKKQQSIDPLTHNKLTKGANCHHRDLNACHYEDLSDPTHFVMYNKMSHDVIHYLYNISKKCGLDELFDRLRGELEPMLAINGDGGLYDNL